MDEIMAAMVLTSLSCSPVIPRPTQREPIPHDPLDVECGGGELSDSGSSGYWSWKHGSVSPVPSPSITETEVSMGLALAARDELSSRRCKSLSRGAYRCLWPGCGKVLTSRTGIKRHIRILHLGSVCHKASRSALASSGYNGTEYPPSAHHHPEATAPSERSRRSQKVPQGVWRGVQGSVVHRVSLKESLSALP